VIDPAPLVHIGFHKTGTTWFQRRFLPHATSHRFIPRSTAKAALLRDHALGFDPSVAAGQLMADDARPPVICEEALSGDWRTGGLMGAMTKEAAERIQRTLPRARIVIFIRNQVAMLASLYSQYIRNGGSHPPERFFFPAHFNEIAANRPFRRPTFQFEHLHYRALIEHYQAMFGSERVHVR